MAALRLHASAREDRAELRDPPRGGSRSGTRNARDGAWAPPGRAAVVLVGIDPPYRDSLAEEAHAARLGARWLPADGADPRALEGGAAVLCVAALGAREDAPERLVRLRRCLGGAPLVALAHRPDVEHAVRLVRAGAADVIALPDEAARVASRSLAHRLPAREDGLDGLVGEGPQMRSLRRRLQQLAACPSTVLLTGETGTGKGEAARALHRLGTGAGAPFVHLDCAALAPGVIESELFGHARGAFTGAHAARRGRLEDAVGGTLFLDEIAELPLPLQAKLLRVLEDRRFEPVGGGATRRLEARVVAATNVDLERAVAEGRFRADLLYRLDVARLRLPPLRERREDLPALVEEGLRRVAARLGLPCPAATPALLGRLEARAWPGNVRELLNTLERLLVFRAADPLDAADLGALEEEETAAAGGAHAGAPAPAAVGAAAGAVGAAAPGSEAARIAAALRASGGNVSRAARRLGLPRSTLRARIARHGLARLIPRD